jgi:hypothetical protein
VLRAVLTLIPVLVVSGCGGSGPGPGQTVGPCTVYSPDARGGGYGVGDAGVVEVYLERDELLLVQVRPATGWESELVTEVSGEIVVAFSRGGERYTFAAFVDGDALAAQWCP